MKNLCISNYEQEAQQYVVCKFFSGDMALKCAVNPQEICEKCKEFECSDYRPLNTEDAIFIINRYPTGIQLVIDNFFREHCWHTGGFIPKDLVEALAKDVKDFFVSCSLDAENPPDWTEIAGHLFCEFIPSDVDQLNR